MLGEVSVSVVKRQTGEALLGTPLPRFEQMY